MSGTFEAAVHFDMRLPELFCGFTALAGRSAGRLSGRLPAAGLVGRVGLHAAAGLPWPRIDGLAGEVHVDRPRLPIGIDHLTIRRLGVGTVAVDLSFQRVGDRVVSYLEHATRAWCR